MKKWTAIGIPIAIASAFGIYSVWKKRVEEEEMKKEELEFLQRKYSDEKCQEALVLKILDYSLLISMQQFAELASIMKLLAKESIIKSKTSQSAFKAKCRFAGE